MVSHIFKIAMNIIILCVGLARVQIREGLLYIH